MAGFHIPEMQFSLRELRARKNKTQQQVAEAVGVSPQTYNAWEQDVSGVALSKIYKLAEYFDVSIVDIKM